METKEDSNVLAVVMANSLSGGLNNPATFDQDFNLLLPLALKECDGDAACQTKKQDMMILLMAMQAGNPNSPMTSESILPLLLMKDSSDNQNLLLFMAMGMNTPCQAPVISRPVPQPEPEVIRTYTVPRPAPVTIARPQPVEYPSYPILPQPIRTYTVPRPQIEPVAKPVQEVIRTYINQPVTTGEESKVKQYMIKADGTKVEMTVN